MGTCNAASKRAGGSAGTAQRERDVDQQDFILTPKNSDEISERINNADNIKLAARSITLKNEDDKTVGVIRDMQRLSSMGDNAQFRELSDIKRKGQLQDVREVGYENVFLKDNKMYIFKPVGTESYLRKAYIENPASVKSGGNWATEAANAAKKNAAYRRLEQQGAIIIKGK